MLRSDPGAWTGLPATSTVPSVAGNCGRSPAISRSTVDLPQPDGPRMAMNSPLFGRSGTENVTSRITVRSPKRFVTPWKSTTLGGADAATGPLAFAVIRSFLDGPVRKQSALEEEQEAIDAVGEQSDDDQDQDDVLGQSTTLARHQQVAETVLRVDQFGQHDVAERQAEEMPQAVVDVGQRERHEHFSDNLDG